MRPQRHGYVARDIAGEAVVDGLSSSLRFDDALPPQNREVLRHERWLKAKFGSKAANALISLNQAANNHETMRARQRSQEVARLTRPQGHISSLYIHTCVYAVVRIYCQHRRRRSGRKSWLMSLCLAPDWAA